MNDLSTIIQENKAYWSGRAEGYSSENREELAGGNHHRWSETLRSAIQGHFGIKEPETIRVLDIGTGPGFFAIILTELGYDVTAVDLTEEMLGEARRNAGMLASIIDFRRMNAEALDIASESYDVIVTRNLTWNLPHPELAYAEWRRVLRRGGLLLNFDANWYSYLFDRAAMEGFEADRANSRALGLNDKNIGENFDVMEDIARRIPLSPVSRPGWDRNVLEALGFRVSTDEDVWKRVWSQHEQINFASTPMFMISAVR